MEAAFKKARLHRVTPVGSMEHQYEVMCRDKAGMGVRREKHVQECVLRTDACICSCHKPKLVHLLCTHVIAACFEAGGLQPRMYVSNYFMRETIWMTWRHEIYGFRILGDFKLILDKMQLTFRTQIQKCFKGWGDARRNTFGITWIDRRLVETYASARSAMGRVIHTRIARH